MIVTGTARVPDSPYKGLVPFAEEDAPFFFGRENEQEIISANLQAYRLTLLYGPSGVGKSSVLHAGVAHHLRQAARSHLAAGVPPEHVVVVFGSWRDDPMERLLERIHSSVSDAIGRPANGPSPGGLSDTLEHLSTAHGTDFLIILDQFEEYFLYHPTDASDGTFASEFAKAVTARNLRANFLVSIREDALAKLDRFKGRIPGLFDNYLRIDHLDRDAAVKAIERPLAQFNALRQGRAPAIRIDPPLRDAVLDQLRTGQVALGGGRGEGAARVAGGQAEDRIETPYLQLVMTRLWKEEREAASDVLRLETLIALGGAERIVRTHLDGVMSTLTAGERQNAARAFRYLVTPSGTKIAHTLSDLSEYSGVAQLQLERLAHTLSSSDIRILRPVAPPAGQAQPPRYEIFHDVLASAIADWRGRVDAERRAQVNNFLRPLHRWAWTLSSRYGAASIAIAGALLMAIMQNPDSSQWNVPNWIVSSIIFGGLLLMTGTVVASARRYGRIVAAIQCGFSWSVIADTIADRRGDIGDLHEGTGRYDKVAAPVRDRFRARRRVQAAIMLFAAVVPLVGIIAVVALGARDVIEPDAAPDIVVVPSIVLLCVFAVIAAMNAYALWKARRSSARAMGASTEWRRSSRDYFEGIGPGQASAAAVRRARQVGWAWRLALMALLAGTALAAIPIMLATIVGSILLEIAVPNWSRFDDQMRLRDAAMRERTDPAISPLAAGQAFYSLTEAGRTFTPGADELPVPRVLPPPWDPKDDENPFGADVTAVFDTLLTRAGAGLTRSQRQYLQRIAGFPGLSEAAVVARAPFVDYLGARLRPDNRVTSPLYPFPSLQSLRGVTRVYLAKAALELADGRHDEAVATMQELISLSLVVIDNAHSLIQALIGRSMLDSGLKGLEQLYAATGNEERAQAIRLRREAATTVTDLPDPPATIPIVNLARTREGTFAMATSTGRLPAVRWEALAMISFFPCSNAQELIFGPTDAYEAAFERARPTLVRFPSEQRFLDNIRLTVELSGEAAVTARVTGLLNRAAQFIGRLFSSERILGCAVALT